MAGNKKPKGKAHKKSARPGKYRADASAIYRVMGVSQSLPKVEVMQIMQSVWLAYDAFKFGFVQEPDYHTLVSMLNVSLILGKRTHPDCAAVCDAALNGMNRSFERFQNCGKWGLDAMALKDIKDALELFQQFLELCTTTRLATAMNEVLKLNKGAQKQSALTNKIML